ncbi:DNA cytosine methyltransferase [Stenotrophomonas rhizophila]|uniref:DNA cytosine methyltransferase n=1 Tax=Stenotrophomonas rhizophila TaxID=216778 RepID=UPI00224B01F3|nr:DNA cytosine methyltransferase [Stenotrophomonas rhizophila]MCX2921510.1 DNA cytosine methyltransferase [Stenotrophomonas rhizophila]
MHRVADLFSGAGGLSLGFSSAGFDIAFATDHDSDSLATYSSNFNHLSAQMDLSRGTPRSVASQIIDCAGEIDVLIGGPPCQGFSLQRRGAAVDPRNDLLLRHVQIGLALNVKAILIENVPAILGVRGADHLAKVYSLLSRKSYHVTSRVLQAADYGVPQLRRRAFVVALRNDCCDRFDFEAPLHLPDSYKTVRDAFEGIPSPPINYEVHPNFKNHQRRRVSELNLKRLSFVPEGGGRLDIPEELRLPCHRKDNGHRHLDVYGRMSWRRPAPTITAMFDSFTRGRFAHPEEVRNITNREGARLQSFPDSFIFTGDQKSVARQIGNAVPPLLAASVARSMLAHLSPRDSAVDLGKRVASKRLKRG